jgi:DNA-binding FadR family transcriptional regulator
LDQYKQADDELKGIYADYCFFLLILQHSALPTLQPFYAALYAAIQ